MYEEIREKITGAASLAVRRASKQKDAKTVALDLAGAIEAAIELIEDKATEEGLNVLSSCLEKHEEYLATLEPTQ